MWNGSSLEESHSCCSDCVAICCSSSKTPQIRVNFNEDPASHAKKICFLIQFILLRCLIVLLVMRSSAAELNCLWVSVMVIVWIKCWMVAQKIQDNKGFPLFFFSSLMTYLVYFADDYDWPLNPSWCGYGRGSISISGTRGNEHKERASAKGWLKLQKRIWGTAVLIMPTFLSSLSLSSSQLCQQASIPYWESDPRLYSVSSLRNEIDL